MKKSNILLAGFLLLLNSCTAQKTELKLNLENGKEYTQTMIAKSNIVQNLNGQSVKMDMTILGKTSYSVKSVSDSYYDMDVKCKHPVRYILPFLISQAIFHQNI